MNRFKLSEHETTARPAGASGRYDLNCSGAPMCPYEYKVWAQAVEGNYVVPTDYLTTNL